MNKSVVIMSYQFAAKLEAELRAIPWDVVVIDEAHKLRNAHRASNRTGQALKRALQGRKKLLLTATPLQEFADRALRTLDHHRRAPVR